jgi:radical SAM modification target selenobiotic family peptide
MASQEFKTYLAGCCLAALLSGASLANPGCAVSSSG